MVYTRVTLHTRRTSKGCVKEYPSTMTDQIATVGDHQRDDRGIIDLFFQFRYFFSMESLMEVGLTDTKMRFPDKTPDFSLDFLTSCLNIYGIQRKRNYQK